MFIQEIEGKVSDPSALRAQIERWRDELSSGATGWQGTTAGVTDDGQFFAAARFESEEAARRNSDRPEQGQWWEQVSKLFEGEATFRESSDVDVDLRGNPDEAGFVQVIKGRTTDPQRARQLMKQDEDTWASFRPDVLGSVAINHEGGAYTMVIYFTSEAEAREGERKEPPAEMKAVMEEMSSLEAGQPSFLDIRDPWLYSAT